MEWPAHPPLVGGGGVSPTDFQAYTNDLKTSSLLGLMISKSHKSV